MKYLRRYIRELLREARETIPIGLCYPFAVEKAIEWIQDGGENDLDLFKVVHGRTTDRWTDKTIEHAWVEIGDMIFDWQSHSTKPDGVPRDVWYDIFQPEPLEEYTARETTSQCHSQGHTGPWRDEK